MEDRRYAVLSKETVRMFGESVGFDDLPDDVVDTLSEDVTYRLREMIQHSCHFLRHGRRKKLTAEDVNKALRNSDTPVIHGYGTQEVLPFREIKDGEMYFVEDLDIDLPHIASGNQGPPLLPPINLKAHWLAVEGVQNTDVLPQGLQAKLTTKSSAGVTEDHLLYYDNVTKAILGNDEEIMKLALVDLRTNTKIAPLMPYFTNFFANGVRTVNYDVTQLTKLLHTVRALTSNQSLSLQPKPYLELIVQGVLCCVVEPLAASINPLNDHWRLRVYAARLLAQVTRQWSTPLNRLREENVLTLKQVLCDLSKPSCSHFGAVMGLLAFGTQAIEDVVLPHLPQLWPHIESIMADNSYSNILVKADAHKVQGALLLAADYVVKARVMDVLTSSTEEIEASPPTPVLMKPSDPPTLTTEHQPSDGIKSEGSRATPENTQILEAPDLVGPVLALPDASYPNKKLADLYAYLYEYFGDSLSMRNAVRHVDGVYIVRREQVQITLSDDAESKKSGEELLKQFTAGIDDIEMPELKEMGRLKKRTSSDLDYDLDEKSERSERSSRSSRSHSDENLSFLGEDSDMTVQATVSDPSQGIKLTILKRPKVKIFSDVEDDEVKLLPADDDDEEPSPHLDTKPATLKMETYFKVSKPKEISEVFDVEPMIINNVYFVFRFLGCQQVCKAKRNSKRTDEPEIMPKSEYKYVSKCLKLFGKRKVTGQTKRRFKSALHHYSGNLNNIL